MSPHRRRLGRGLNAARRKPERDASERCYPQRLVDGRRGRRSPPAGLRPELIPGGRPRCPSDVIASEVAGGPEDRQSPKNEIPLSRRHFGNDRAAGVGTGRTRDVAHLRLLRIHARQEAHAADAAGPSSDQSSTLTARKRCRSASSGSTMAPSDCSRPRYWSGSATGLSMRPAMLSSLICDSYVPAGASTLLSGLIVEHAADVCGLRRLRNCMRAHVSAIVASSTTGGSDAIRNLLGQ